MKDQEVLRTPHAGLNRRERLQFLHQRTQALQRRHTLLTAPINAGIAGPGAYVGDTERASFNGRLDAHFKTILAATEADLEQIAKADEAARDHGDRERVSHNGLRIETLNNWVNPSLLFASSFFEVVNLQPGEQPLYRKVTKGEIDIFAYGKNGKPKRKTLTDTDFFQNGAPISLSFLKSARVEYPLLDLNRGNIRDAVLETFDLGVDMAARVDKEAFDFANANGASYVASFDFTGADKLARLVNAHSRIKTDNFPAGNLVAAGANPKLLDILRGAKDYVARWGTGAFRDGDLSLTGRIFMAPKDIDRIWGQSDLTGVSAAKSALGEKVQAEGWTSFHFLGTDWMIVPDNTMAPATASAASGALYIQTNKPIGTMFLIPALDKEIVKTEEDSGEWGGDLESRYLRKALGFVIPDNRKPNGYKVTFSFA
jgi:hypothetical protein